MQRCLQCDFIYEDDQRLCDMDGAKLVRHSSPLPDGPSSQKAIPPVIAERNLFAVGAIAGFVLLFSGSYVFTHQTAPDNTNHSSSMVAAEPQPARNGILPTAAATATASPSMAPKANVNAFKDLSPIGKVSPALSQSPARKRYAQKSKPENTNAKKASKIGSIFKKTRRLLRKPFKF